jgi:chemotaxis protein methyltransferase CheR
MTPSADREYRLTDKEFEQIRSLVRRNTGISLAESKRELVYSRLVRRLRHRGLDTFGAYVELLEQNDPGEIEEFTNAITTNLTSFFRESHHFEYLREEVLPLIEKRNADQRRLRIWSAGCSTGEEPYSLAMILHESMSRFRGWDVRILATDLDSNVLAHARAGAYRPDRLETLQRARRERWFRQSADGLVASSELKSLITFKQLNLMHPWPFHGPFDVIFCRNVVIYFDKSTQRDLFERVAGMQHEGSHLFIGHSESLFKVTDRYQLIGKTIYRRAP